MLSRYSYMRDSGQFDIDGETFPDPLTIDYTQLDPEALTEGWAINSCNFKKPWKFYYDHYGDVELDDIWLHANYIPHVGVVEPGDNLYHIATGAISQYSFKDLK